MSDVNNRLQFAVVACDRGVWDKMMLLCSYFENESHLPRLADVPASLDDAALGGNVSRALRNYVLPFAMIAVAGNEAAVRHAQKLCFAVRRRVPVMLVMCPFGYRVMKDGTDPCFSMGHPPESNDVVGSILLGGEDAFEGYSTQQFGRPHHLPDEGWQSDSVLGELVEQTRRLIRPAKSVVRC